LAQRISLDSGGVPKTQVDQLARWKLNLLATYHTESSSLVTSSLDVNNLEHARLVRGLLIRAVNADNLAAWLAEILLLGLLDC